RVGGGLPVGGHGDFPAPLGVAGLFLPPQAQHLLEELGVPAVAGLAPLGPVGDELGDLGVDEIGGDAVLAELGDHVGGGCPVGGQQAGWGARRGRGEGGDRRRFADRGAGGGL